MTGFYDGIVLKRSDRNIIKYNRIINSINDGISLLDESNFNKIFVNKTFLIGAVP